MSKKIVTKSKFNQLVLESVNNVLNELSDEYLESKAKNFWKFDGDIDSLLKVISEARESVVRGVSRREVTAEVFEKIDTIADANHIPVDVVNAIRTLASYILRKTDQTHSIRQEVNNRRSEAFKRNRGL